MKSKDISPVVGTLALALLAISPATTVVVSGNVITGSGTFIQLFPSFTDSTPGNYVRVFTERSPGANNPDGGSSMLLIGTSLPGLAGFKRFTGKR